MDFSSVLTKIKGLWGRMDAAVRKRLIVLAVMLASGLAVLGGLLNRTYFVPLYSGLTPSEAAEIYQKLSDRGFDVKLQGETAIWVDSEKEDESRMAMAAEGYPQSGFSYDLYTDHVCMGTSESEKNQYKVFQLQDRLQCTIESLDGVRGAIVTLSIPDNDIFTLRENRDDVTASVVLDLSTGSLDNEQVDAIRNLVANSVSGLSCTNVSIVDTEMNLLGCLTEGGLDGTDIRYTLEKNLERDFEERILSMLEPIFGKGQVKTAVSVSLNFDAQVTESVLYEPAADGQGIPLSVEETKERLESSGDSGNSKTSNSQISTTYQISQVVKKLEPAKGSIEGLSASVIVNRETLETGDIDEIRAITAYALGTDLDNINIAALPFVQLDAAETALAGAKIPGWLDRELILGFVAIVFTFALVLAGILTFRKRKTHGISMPGTSQTKGSNLEEIPVNINPESGYRKEIEKFVDRRPDEVARLLKKWVAEEK